MVSEVSLVCDAPIELVWKGCHQRAGSLDTCQVTLERGAALPVLTHTLPVANKDKVQGITSARMPK